MLVNIEINGNQSARVRWCKKNGLVEDACVLTLYRPLDCEVDADSAWPPSTNCDLSVDGHDAGDEECLETKRSSWSNPLEFLFSCISMSIGLGNVWKFPGIAYKNGGVAFLVPYMIVLFVIGWPLYFIEMSIGQFSSSGPVQAWNMVPLFRGVGYTATLGTACVLSYYVSLMGQSAYYMFLSFNAVLPWSRCSADWTGDDLCVDGVFQINQTTSSLSYLYYRNRGFPQLQNIDDGIGSPNLNLTICLFISWAIVFLSLVTGVTNSGKLAYLTALLPYGILVTLLIRGATIPGGWDGITTFLTPDWHKVLKLEVWLAAVGQCFFSLSTASGPVIMLASHNSFRQNVYRDAILVCIVDSLTSILAALTTFAFLGNLATKYNIYVKDVDTIGADFAFTFYPEAFSDLEFAPQLFSALYFLLLFTLGLGSSTAMTSLIITTVRDRFPHWRKWGVTTLTCLIGFAVGFIYVTPGGPRIVDLIDTFGAGFVIYVAAILELVGICWIYGASNISRDIEFMLGKKISPYFKFCWVVLIPLGLSVILVCTVKEQIENIDVQELPAWAIGAGWILAMFSLLLIPLLGIAEVYSMRADTILLKFKMSLRATKEWGPKTQDLRRAWMEYKTGRMPS